jgi:hypothetical protein
MEKTYNYKSGKTQFLVMTVVGEKKYGIAADELVKRTIAGPLKNKVFLNPYHTMATIDAAFDSFRKRLESLAEKKNREMEDFSIKLDYNFPGFNIDKDKLTKLAVSYGQEMEHQAEVMHVEEKFDEEKK